MRRRSRVVANAVLAIAVSAVLAACTSGHHATPRATASSVTAATADALPSVRYPPPEGAVGGVPTAHNGVMDSFTLDRGAFTVVQPPSWLHPAEPMSRALGAAKEADQQAFLPDFDARPVVGYGLVTINGSYWRKPAYHNTPAWVVAYTDNRPTSCPAMPLRTSPPPKPSPPLPKHHYTVFVLPDAETWAVTFDERSLAPCFGTVRPSSAELAHTQQLVVWHEVSRHGRRVTLGYTIPSCAEAAGAESSANTKANSLTIQLAEALPFGHPPNCTDRLPKTMDWDLITPTTTLTPPHAGPADF